jgi:hypothetical protein
LFVNEVKAISLAQRVAVLRLIGAHLFLRVVRIASLHFSRSERAIEYSLIAAATEVAIISVADIAARDVAWDSAFGRK